MALNYAKSNTFVTGTTITSSSVNANFDDLVNIFAGLEALTKSYSNLLVDTVLRSTGTIQLADGTVSAPALTFTSELGTGVYRIGTGNIGFATSGVRRLDIAPTLMSAAVSQIWSTTTAATPALTVQKANSGAGNESGGILTFQNLHAAGLARSANVIAGKILFQFSQPSSGAAQDAAAISVLSDAQGGSGTASSMALQTVSSSALVTALTLDSSQKATFAGAVVLSSTVNSNIQFDSAATHGIVGTTTNDSAAAGNVAEYISSTWTSVASPATTTFGDATSIVLTGGDWDIEVHAELGINEVASVTRHILGVSTTSGNSATGLTQGTTRMDYVVPGANANMAACIGRVRASVSGSTTYYVKVSGTYTGTAPTSSGIISARRSR